MERREFCKSLAVVPASGALASITGMTDSAIADAPAQADKPRTGQASAARRGDQGPCCGRLAMREMKLLALFTAVVAAVAVLGGGGTSAPASAGSMVPRTGSTASTQPTTPIAFHCAFTPRARRYWLRAIRTQFWSLNIMATLWKRSNRSWKRSKN